MTNNVKISINGKEIMLTDEQMAQLGLATKADEPEKKEWRQKPSFRERYHYIGEDGSVKHDYWDEGFCECVKRFEGSDGINYFPFSLFTEEQVRQISLMNQLNTLLAQYAVVNGALASKEERIDENKELWFFMSGYIRTSFYIYPNSAVFNDYDIAEQAVKDVVEPFLAEHQEFVW